MKKLRLILGVLTLMSVTSFFGQQDPQYTQYMYNMNVINPAYAGSRGVTSIGLLGRTQWASLEGAPRTLTLAMHSPVGRAVGLGFSVIHDEIGPVKEDNVYADFSYTIFTGEEGRLAFGLKAGATFLNVREVIMVDNPDPLNEPINQTSPNFGAGIYYYTNKFYVGLSAPNFLETEHLDKRNGVVSTASEQMSYFLTSGYVFDISRNLKLKPSTMLRVTPNTPLSADLSLNLFLDETIELGLSHRLDDSISGMVGFQVNSDFRIGYAYDYTTTRFGNFNSGSHEVMLLLDINKKRVKSSRCFCF